jgi:hypothetical protein
VLLDRCGGRGAERASATLIAAGVIAALPAAATRLADWSALHRHHQRVGLVHAIAQTAATALFAGSLLARAAGRRGAGYLLSASGLAAATAGGYLGGHLAPAARRRGEPCRAHRAPGRAGQDRPVPPG